MQARTRRCLLPGGHLPEATLEEAAKGRGQAGAHVDARTLAGQADGYAQLVLPAGSARTRACTRVGYTSSTRAATSGGGSAGGRGA